MNDLPFLAFLLGEAIGALLMLVSIVFAIRGIGDHGAAELDFLGRVRVGNLTQATLIFLVGAAFAGGPIYLLLDGSDEPATAVSPAVAASAATPAARSAGPARVDPGEVTPSASTAHPPQAGNDYDPRNTLDGSLATAWNAHGRAVGEWLRYEFAHPVRLTEIGLVNGYAKTPATFRDNVRLRRITIATDGGTSSHTLADTSEAQRLKRDFGTTTTVTITVDAVYPGARWNDAALTEIEFFGERR